MAFKDLEIPMYNGEITCSYKNTSHRYYIDKKLVPGVTTTINKIIAKTGLMTWAMDMAIKHIRTKIPVVTEQDLKDAAQAYIKARNKGGDTGTTVHGIIEQIIMGEKPDIESQTEEVKLAISAFEQWCEDFEPEFLATEQVVYSKEYNYAGTFDAVARIGDAVYLLDFKTTNASKEAPRGIYAENFIQLGAYLTAYDEQRDYEGDEFTDLPAIDGLMIASIKKTGKYDVAIAADFGLSNDDCKHLWIACWGLADQLGKIKKMLMENK